MNVYYIIRNNDLHTRPNYNNAIYRHVQGALYIMYLCNIQTCTLYRVLCLAYLCTKLSKEKMLACQI